jgi:hypothetical protein
MRKVLMLGVLAIAVAGFLGLGAGEVAAQSHFAQVTGKDFDSGFVKDFYLEGNSIPTQKRNAAMLKGHTGKRLVFALLDTSGYGTDIQQKYTGLALLEAKTTIGALTLGVGAYGFGIKKGAADGPVTVIFYDIAGEKVGEAIAAYDKDLKQPVPLAVAVEPARLCLGKNCLEIK